MHVETFAGLFAEHPGAKVAHVVRADLLEQARTEGPDAVADDTRAAMQDLSEADAVLCTCSTLGPLIGDAPHHLRIDRPAMQAAVQAGPNVIVAICLESTRTPTLDLLAQVARDLSRPVRPRLVLCDAAWPLFEAGDQAGFSVAIAKAVVAELEGGGTADCILLAQASMRVAAPLLPGHCPVLTTPELAVQAAIELAGR